MDRQALPRSRAATRATPRGQCARRASRIHRRSSRCSSRGSTQRLWSELRQQLLKPHKGRSFRRGYRLERGEVKWILSAPLVQAACFGLFRCSRRPSSQQSRPPPALAASAQCGDPPVATPLKWDAVQRPSSCQARMRRFLGRVVQSRSGSVSSQLQSRQVPKNFRLGLERPPLLPRRMKTRPRLTGVTASWSGCLPRRRNGLLISLPPSHLEPDQPSPWA